jgi:hypothetical protein
MVAAATKVDYARELSHLYRAHEEPELVEVPPFHYLMVDGHGDPADSKAFRLAVDALYAAAYGLKNRIRKLDAIDYGVMPLEGLWWIPNARVWDFGNKSDWDWTLMVMQPELVTQELVDEETAKAGRRRKGLLPVYATMRFERFHEGLSAQVLHRGSFGRERPTLERLYAFIREQGFLPTGKHHEIYLSDPSSNTAGKLRTIVRQPVTQRSARVDTQP